MAKYKVKKSKDIERKIHFFYVRFSQTQVSSSNFADHPDPGEIINRIADLQFRGEHLKSRYKHYPNDDVSFLIDTEMSEKEDYLKGRFAISRRSALPELEVEGALKTLSIPANSGLAEITHFIYFKEKKILGVEFNFHGPRATALTNYLEEKSNNFKDRFDFVEIRPILNQDIDAQLQDVGEVNLFKMEVARNELELLRELDEDLHSAFEGAAKVSDEFESIEVALIKKKYSRGGFRLPFTRKSLKELLSKDDNRQKINSLKVDAESISDGKAKVFDLLEDKMIVSKKIAAQSPISRSVDSKSMFQKIEEAYNELKDNFQK
ncbi:hypothetical protein [Shouchella clausii]|uniref:hypothetical protein n=1 Tax=Shouchella clausii TaxID=79880 RepID=UPI001C72BBFD|nr:hypothetical protein [Shouchella clausii]MBX0319739.1 hypothetical protein [Shouchella clausii]